MGDWELAREGRNLAVAAGRLMDADDRVRDTPDCCWCFLSRGAAVADTLLCSAWAFTLHEAEEDIAPCCRAARFAFFVLSPFELRAFMRVCYKAPAAGLVLRNTVKSALATSNRHRLLVAVVVAA